MADTNTIKYSIILDTNEATDRVKELQQSFETLAEQKNKIEGTVGQILGGDESARSDRVSAFKASQDNIPSLASGVSFIQNAYESIQDQLQSFNLFMESTASKMGEYTKFIFGNVSKNITSELQNATKSVNRFIYGENTGIATTGNTLRKTADGKYVNTSHVSGFNDATLSAAAANAATMKARRLQNLYTTSDSYGSLNADQVFSMLPSLSPAIMKTARKQSVTNGMQSLDVLINSLMKDQSIQSAISSAANSQVGSTANLSDVHKRNIIETALLSFGGNGLYNISGKNGFAFGYTPTVKQKELVTVTDVLPATISGLFETRGVNKNYKPNSSVNNELVGSDTWNAIKQMASQSEHAELRRSLESVGALKYDKGKMYFSDNLRGDQYAALRGLTVRDFYDAKKSLPMYEADPMGLGNRNQMLNRNSKRSLRDREILSILESDARASVFQAGFIDEAQLKKLREQSNLINTDENGVMFTSSGYGKQIVIPNAVVKGDKLGRYSKPKGEGIFDYIDPKWNKLGIDKDISEDHFVTIGESHLTRMINRLGGVEFSGKNSFGVTYDKDGNPNSPEIISIPIGDLLYKNKKNGFGKTYVGSDDLVEFMGGTKDLSFRYSTQGDKDEQKYHYAYTNGDSGIAIRTDTLNKMNNKLASIGLPMMFNNGDPNIISNGESYETFSKRSSSAHREATAGTPISELGMKVIKANYVDPEMMYNVYGKLLGLNEKSLGERPLVDSAILVDPSVGVGRTFQARMAGSEIKGTMQADKYVDLFRKSGAIDTFIENAKKAGLTPDNIAFGSSFFMPMMASKSREKEIASVYEALLTGKRSSIFDDKGNSLLTIDIGSVSSLKSRGKKNVLTKEEIDFLRENYTYDIFDSSRNAVIGKSSVKSETKGSEVTNLQYALFKTFMNKNKGKLDSDKYLSDSDINSFFVETPQTKKEQEALARAYYKNKNIDLQGMHSLTREEQEQFMRLKDFVNGGPEIVKTSDDFLTSKGIIPYSLVDSMIVTKQQRDLSNKIFEKRINELGTDYGRRKFLSSLPNYKQQLDQNPNFAYSAKANRMIASQIDSIKRQQSLGSLATDDDAFYGVAKSLPVESLIPLLISKEGVSNDVIKKGLQSTAFGQGLAAMLSDELIFTGNSFDTSKAAGVTRFPSSLGAFNRARIVNMAMMKEYDNIGPEISEKEFRKYFSPDDYIVSSSGDEYITKSGSIFKKTADGKIIFNGKSGDDHTSDSAKIEYMLRKSGNTAASIKDNNLVNAAQTMMDLGEIADEPAFYTTVATLYGLNTGDNDGDTVFVFNALQDLIDSNVVAKERLQKAQSIQNKLHKLDPKKRPASAVKTFGKKAITQEQIDEARKKKDYNEVQRLEGIRAGQMRAEEIGNYFAAQGVMGIGSMAQREITRAIANGDDSEGMWLALADAIRFYDLGTSEVQKKGEQHDVPNLIKPYIKMGNINKRFWEKLNKSGDGTKKMSPDDIFKTRLIGKNDYSAISEAYLAQMSQLRTGEDLFTYEEEANAYLDELYGKDVDDPMRKLAASKIGLLRKQSFGRGFLSNKDIFSFSSAINEAQTALTTRLSEGKISYDDAIAQQKNIERAKDTLKDINNGNVYTEETSKEQIDSLVSEINASTSQISDEALRKEILDYSNGSLTSNQIRNRLLAMKDSNGVSYFGNKKERNNLARNIDRLRMMRGAQEGNVLYGDDLAYDAYQTAEQRLFEDSRKTYLLREALKNGMISKDVDADKQEVIDESLRNITKATRGHGVNSATNLIPWITGNEKLNQKLTLTKTSFMDPKATDTYETLNMYEPNSIKVESEKLGKIEDMILNAVGVETSTQTSFIGDLLHATNEAMLTGGKIGSVDVKGKTAFEVVKMLMSRGGELEEKAKAVGLTFNENAKTGSQLFEGLVNEQGSKRYGESVNAKENKLSTFFGDEKTKGSVDKFQDYLEKQGYKTVSIEGTKLDKNGSKTLRPDFTEGDTSGTGYTSVRPDLITEKDGRFQMWDYKSSAKSAKDAFLQMMMYQAGIEKSFDDGTLTSDLEKVNGKIPFDFKGVDFRNGSIYSLSSDYKLMIGEEEKTIGDMSSMLFSDLISTGIIEKQKNLDALKNGSKYGSVVEKALRKKYEDAIQKAKANGDDTALQEAEARLNMLNELETKSVSDMKAESEARKIASKYGNNVQVSEFAQQDFVKYRDALIGIRSESNKHHFASLFAGLSNEMSGNDFETNLLTKLGNRDIFNNKELEDFIAQSVDKGNMPQANILSKWLLEGKNVRQEIGQRQLEDISRDIDYQITDSQKFKDNKYRNDNAKISNEVSATRNITQSYIDLAQRNIGLLDNEDLDKKTRRKQFVENKNKLAELDKLYAGQMDNVLISMIDEYKNEFESVSKGKGSVNKKTKDISKEINEQVDDMIFSMISDRAAQIKNLEAQERAAIEKGGFKQAKVLRKAINELTTQNEELIASSGDNAKQNGLRSDLFYENRANRFNLESESASGKLKLINGSKALIANNNKANTLVAETRKAERESAIAEKRAYLANLQNEYRKNPNQNQWIKDVYGDSFVSSDIKISSGSLEGYLNTFKQRYDETSAAGMNFNIASKALEIINDYNKYSTFSEKIDPIFAERDLFLASRRSELTSLRNKYLENPDENRYIKDLYGEDFVSNTPGRHDAAIKSIVDREFENYQKENANNIIFGGSQNSGLRQRRNKLNTISTFGLSTEQISNALTGIDLLDDEIKLNEKNLYDQIYRSLFPESRNSQLKGEEASLAYKKAIHSMRGQYVEDLQNGLIDQAEYDRRMAALDSLNIEDNAKAVGNRAKKQYELDNAAARSSAYSQMLSNSNAIWSATTGKILSTDEIVAMEKAKRESEITGWESKLSNDTTLTEKEKESLSKKIEDSKLSMKDGTYEQLIRNKINLQNQLKSDQIDLALNRMSNYGYLTNLSEIGNTGLYGGSRIERQKGLFNFGVGHISQIESRRAGTFGNDVFGRANRERYYELQTLQYQRDQAMSMYNSASEKLKDSSLRPEEKANYEKQQKEAKAAMDSAQSQMNKTNSFSGYMSALSGQANQMIGQFGTRIITRTLRKAWQEAVRYIKQMDKDMTSIQMITGKSDYEMEGIRSQTLSKAKKLKTSVSNVSQIEGSLYRQGLSDSEVSSRTDAIIKFATVTGANVGNATKALTTAIQNGLVDSVEEAMDALTALGDTAATTSEEIFKGMQKSAAAASDAGISYSELISMLTVITSKTQLSGSSAGTALSTIINRMNKVSKTGYSQDVNGESTSINDVESALKYGGISLRDDSGNFKNTTQVLKELSTVWNDLGDIQQSAITYAIAGTRQANMFSSLMQGISEDNGETFAEYLETAENSEGTTDAKYEIYSNSFEAASASFKASFDSLIESIVSRTDLLTSPLELSTSIFEGIRNINEKGSANGLLGGILTGAGALTGGILGGKLGAMFGPLGLIAGTLVGGGISSFIGNSLPKTDEQLNDEARERNQLAKDALLSKYTDVNSAIDTISDVSRTAFETNGIDSYRDSLQKLTLAFPELADSVSKALNEGTWQSFSKVISETNILVKDFNEKTIPSLTRLGLISSSQNPLLDSYISDINSDYLDISDINLANGVKKPFSITNYGFAVADAVPYNLAYDRMYGIPGSKKLKNLGYQFNGTGQSTPRTVYYYKNGKKVNKKVRDMTSENWNDFFASVKDDDERAKLLGAFKDTNGTEYVAGKEDDYSFYSGSDFLYNVPKLFNVSNLTDEQKTTKSMYQRLFTSFSSTDSWKKVSESLGLEESTSFLDFMTKESYSSYRDKLNEDQPLLKSLIESLYGMFLDKSYLSAMDISDESNYKFISDIYFGDQESVITDRVGENSSIVKNIFREKLIDYFMNGQGSESIKDNEGILTQQMIDTFFGDLMNQFNEDPMSFLYNNSSYSDFGYSIGKGPNSVGVSSTSREKILEAINATEENRKKVIDYLVTGTDKNKTKFNESDIDWVKLEREGLYSNATGNLVYSPASTIAKGIYSSLTPSDKGYSDQLSLLYWIASNSKDFEDLDANMGHLFPELSGILKNNPELAKIWTSVINKDGQYSYADLVNKISEITFGEGGLQKQLTSNDVEYNAIAGMRYNIEKNNYGAMAEELGISSEVFEENKTRYIEAYKDLATMRENKLFSDLTDQYKKLFGSSAAFNYDISSGGITGFTSKFLDYAGINGLSKGKINWINGYTDLSKFGFSPIEGVETVYGQDADKILLDYIEGTWDNYVKDKNIEFDKNKIKFSKGENGKIDVSYSKEEGSEDFSKIFDFDESAIMEEHEFNPKILGEQIVQYAIDNASDVDQYEMQQAKSQLETYGGHFEWRNGELTAIGENGEIITADKFIRHNPLVRYSTEEEYYTPTEVAKIASYIISKNSPKDMLDQIMNGNYTDDQLNALYSAYPELKELANMSDEQFNSDYGKSLLTTLKVKIDVDKSGLSELEQAGEIISGTRDALAQINTGGLKFLEGMSFVIQNAATAQKDAYIASKIENGESLSAEEEDYIASKYYLPRAEYLRNPSSINALFGDQYGAGGIQNKATLKSFNETYSGITDDISKKIFENTILPLGYKVENGEVVFDESYDFRKSNPALSEKYGSNQEIATSKIKRNMASFVIKGNYDDTTVSDALKENGYNDVEIEDLFSSDSDLALLTQLRSRNKNGAYNEEIETLEKNISIKYAVEGVQELENTQTVLSGTASIIERIKKGGILKIEADLEFNKTLMDIGKGNYLASLEWKDMTPEQQAEVASELGFESVQQMIKSGMSGINAMSFYSDIYKQRITQAESSIAETIFNANTEEERQAYIETYKQAGFTIDEDDNGNITVSSNGVINNPYDANIDILSETRKKYGNKNKYSYLTESEKYFAAKDIMTLAGAEKASENKTYSEQQIQDILSFAPELETLWALESAGKINTEDYRNAQAALLARNNPLKNAEKSFTKTELNSSAMRLFMSSDWEKIASGMSKSELEQIKNSYPELYEWLNFSDAQKSSQYGQNLKRNIELNFQLSGIQELEEAGTIISGISSAIETIKKSDIFTSEAAKGNLAGDVRTKSSGIEALDRIMSSGKGSSEDWAAIRQLLGWDQNMLNIYQSNPALLQSAYGDYSQKAKETLGKSFDTIAMNSIGINTGKYSYYKDKDTGEYIVTDVNGNKLKFLDEQSAKAEADRGNSYLEQANLIALKKGHEKIDGHMTTLGAVWSDIANDGNGGYEYNPELAKDYYDRTYSTASEEAAARLEAGKSISDSDYYKRMMKYDLSFMTMILGAKTIDDITNALDSNQLYRAVLQPTMTSEEYVEATRNGNVKKTQQILMNSLFGFSLEDSLKQLGGYQEALTQVGNINASFKNKNVEAVSSYLGLSNSEKAKLIAGDDEAWESAGKRIERKNKELLEPFEDIVAALADKFGVEDLSGLVGELKSKGGEAGSAIAEVIEGILNVLGIEIEHVKILNGQVNGITPEVSSGNGAMEASLASKKAELAGDEKIRKYLNSLYENISQYGYAKGVAMTASQYSDMTESDYETLYKFAPGLESVFAKDFDFRKNTGDIQDRQSTIFKNSNGKYVYNGIGYDTREEADKAAESSTPVSLVPSSNIHSDQSGLAIISAALGYGDISNEVIAREYVRNFMFTEGYFDKNGLMTEEGREAFTTNYQTNSEFADAMSSYTQYVDAIKNANDLEDATESFRELGEEIGDNFVKKTNKFGNSTDKILGYMDLFSSDAEKSTEAAKSLNSQLSKMRIDKYYRDMYRKGNRDSKTLESIAEQTGRTKESLGSKDILPGLEMELNNLDLKDDKVISEIATTFETHLNDYFQNSGIKIDGAFDVSIGSSGNISIPEDFSSLPQEVQAKIMEKANELASMGLSGHIVSTADEDSFEISVQLDSLEGGKSGGGGGGGKSKFQKYLEELQQKDKEYEHRIKMNQSAGNYYQESGELVNYGKSLVQQSQDQRDLIAKDQQNINDLLEKQKGLKKNSDDWNSCQEAIMKYEEEIQEANITIAKNTKALEENDQAIRKTYTDLEDSVKEVIEANKEEQRSEIEATAQLEQEIADIIRQRYQDEWDLITTDIEKKRQALEEEKTLIDERLQMRKSAEDEANKYTELQSLQAQLAYIQSDTSRTKDAIELRDKIAKLQSEIAWDVAESEAEAQKSIIEDQEEGYDEFSQYGSETLANYLEDANNFVSEIETILSSSQEDIIKWLKENNQEYLNSLKYTQQIMITGWEDTYKQMKGIVETYWSFISQIIGAGEDQYVEWMKQNSLEYQQASDTMKASMESDWRTGYQTMISAFKEDDIENHTDEYLSEIAKKSKDNGEKIDKINEQVIKLVNVLEDDLINNPLLSRNSSSSDVINAMSSIKDYSIENSAAIKQNTEWLQNVVNLFNTVDIPVLTNYNSAGTNTYNTTSTIGDITINIDNSNGNNTDYDALARKIGEQFAAELSKQGFSTANYSF